LKGAKSVERQALNAQPEALEMTGCGKHGKTITVFPLFPQPLEIAAAIPTLRTATTTRKNISQNPSNQNRNNDAQYHYPGGPN
jgi:hypothetical protein